MIYAFSKMLGAFFTLTAQKTSVKHLLWMSDIVIYI